MFGECMFCHQSVMVDVESANIEELAKAATMCCSCMEATGWAKSMTSLDTLCGPECKGYGFEQPIPEYRLEILRQMVFYMLDKQFDAATFTDASGDVIRLKRLSYAVEVARTSKREAKL